MLVGAIVTRLGCLMNGCCAGRPTDGKLGVWLPNTAGEWRRRYPTQVLEAVWAGLLLVAALLARNAMPFDGALCAGVIGVYCAGRVLLQGAREA
jgi:prolipoprotein diacylglyceryltransferase